MNFDHEQLENAILRHANRLTGAQAPPISVVIVAYRSATKLIAALDSLQVQSFPDFEIIVVDNGGNEAVAQALQSYPIRYLQLSKNYYPSFARNVGLIHAQGEYICFLDDDALAHPQFVQQHLAANRSNHLLGVRGKILPKTASKYNSLAAFYDLGDECIPSYVDVEGNSSFSKQLLLDLGGFNSQIFAGEGAELSYRIAKKTGRKDCLLYWPQAVIYHDFAQDFRKYFVKTWRGARMQVKLERMHPDYWEFIESYHPFPHGETQPPNSLGERLQLAAVRRLGRLTRTAGYRWFSLRG